MAITRAQVEQSIVGRLRGKMALAGLSTIADGSNPDLNDPISVALRKLGKPVSNPVADHDLISLTDYEYDELLDRAELRTLQNIVGSLDLVDITVGSRRESLNQLAEQCEKAIARLMRSISTEFGAGITAGTLDLGFQAEFDEAL